MKIFKTCFIFLLLTVSFQISCMASDTSATDPQLVRELQNGIRYRILTKGKGIVSPKFFNRVTTHYEGRLENGTVFDSSYSRKEPATFSLKQVIPGWTSTLQNMVVGDKWEVTIPAHLAYGSRSVGPIPPNSTLVFIIELLEIL